MRPGPRWLILALVLVRQTLLPEYLQKACFGFNSGLYWDYLGLVLAYLTISITPEADLKTAQIDIRADSVV